MSDVGIRISKEGINASNPLVETNKKDFVFLSDDNSPKVIYSGFLTAPDFFTGVSYTHDLGYVPMFFLFATDSPTSPTYYKIVNGLSFSTTTTISGMLMDYGYLIILQEGA